MRPDRLSRQDRAQAWLVIHRCCGDVEKRAAFLSRNSPGARASWPARGVENTLREVHAPEESVTDLLLVATFTFAAEPAEGLEAESSASEAAGRP
jgi:hypothetical protein